MKNSLSLLLTFILLILFVTACNETVNMAPEEENQEFGFLTLQIALAIEVLPAARIAEVNTDNFIVTIHNAADGSEVMRFDPFSSAPAEIELLTGEYFVRATNLDPPANAEFEQPWYFGESTVFNIDKEEVKTIDVTCTLANFKVSFVYSQNVVDNFTDWNATATLINEGDFLFWPMGDDREGYFITSPLDINVYLEYTKVFTGELITRNFVTTIDDPQSATHYRINIDASLEDGKIVINVTVDDSFEVIDIDLGDDPGPGPNPNENWLSGEDWTDVRDDQVYGTKLIGNQTWMTDNMRYNVEPSWVMNNDLANEPDYGRLYMWETVMEGALSSNLNPSGVQGICPVGWHIPSNVEWDELINLYGGPNQAGGALKEVGTDHWLSPNTGATNISGFTARGAGWYQTLSDSFHGFGIWSYAYSSTGLTSGGFVVGIHQGGSMQVGFTTPLHYATSLRCLKD